VIDDPETCEFADLRGIHTFFEPEGATPEDREHTLNVVGEWLDIDSHRFTMPATEWGRELKSAMSHLMGMATAYAEAKAESSKKRNDAIFSAVLDECLGYNGGEPHATTWARGGHRNDVPTLCDRCQRLIDKLQKLDAPAPADETVTRDAEKYRNAQEVIEEVHYRFRMYTGTADLVNRAHHVIELGNAVSDLSTYHVTYDGDTGTLQWERDDAEG